MGKIRIIEQGYTQEELVKAVDEQTKAAIKRHYDVEDELKLLRRTIVSLANQLNVELPEEFRIYNTVAEDAVTQGKKKKGQIVPKSIKIREKRSDINS